MLCVYANLMGASNMVDAPIAATSCCVVRMGFVSLAWTILAAHREFAGAVRESSSNLHMMRVPTVSGVSLPNQRPSAFQNALTC